ncbi:unnamed protein product [Ectocarpus sp. 6 AP-2014]
MELAADISAARNAPGARQTAWMLNGIRTEVVVIPYADRTFVIVTQMKKLGNLLMATSDAAGGMMAGSGGRRYSVQVLLGRRDDPLLCLYARQMLEQMKSDKPLLLAVCLKEEGRDTKTFQEVINQVLSLGGWSG